LSAVEDTQKSCLIFLPPPLKFAQTFCVGAASSPPPPQPRLGHKAGGAGFPRTRRARNGHSTALFANECQSFLDNVIARLGQTGSWNNPHLPAGLTSTAKLNRQSELAEYRFAAPTSGGGSLEGTAKSPFRLPVRTLRSMSQRKLRTLLADGRPSTRRTVSSGSTSTIVHAVPIFTPQADKEQAFRDVRFVPQNRTYAPQQ
jgi:hypothetical protein